MVDYSIKKILKKTLIKGKIILIFPIFLCQDQYLLVGQNNISPFRLSALNIPRDSLRLYRPIRIPWCCAFRFTVFFTESYILQV